MFILTLLSAFYNNTQFAERKLELDRRSSFNHDTVFLIYEHIL